MMKSPKVSPPKAKNLKFTRKFLVAGILCLLFLPFAIFAKTAAEYRINIQISAELVTKLIEYVEKNLESAARDVDFERQTLAEIRQNLPPTERIEWEGGVIETENKWLAEKLKAFEDESNDWTRRKAILSEISERLAAIESKIAALENPVVSDRTKDEDKRKLAEILRREEYQKPVDEQESWFQRIQRRIREWFKRKMPQPDIPEGASQGLQSVSLFLQIILYVVILGLIGFLIYRFAPLFAQKFRRRVKEDNEERVILGEKLGANENAQTLFSQADELARAGNLRGAIRKAYIALLCELSDRKIIGLAQHKTNRDYLRDVRKRGELYQNMRGLTLNFERHWYGFETADEEDWNEFKRDYQKALKES